MFMSGRTLWLLAIVFAAGGVLDAQVGTARPRTSLPKTPDGKPDLQGVWDFTSQVPLERPAWVAGKYELTEAEAIEFTSRLNRERKEFESKWNEAKVGYDLDFWFEDGRDRKAYFTSQVVDPPDGRLPPTTPEARQRMAQRGARFIAAAGPEDRTTSERCLIGLNTGPPITPSVYSNYVQVVQTPDHVVLLTEMVHSARIVPMDNRPATGITQWHGSSRGRWDGDMLVIETTGIRDPEGRSADDVLQRRVTERLKRLDADTLQYEYTMDDRSMYTAPWTARLRMKRISAGIIEYACHEGNHALRNILSTARVVEKKGAK
jgi:hypothetical protein